MFVKIYRISDKGSPFPQHFNFMTKKICYRNFMDVFGAQNTIVIADNCSQETISWIKEYYVELIETNLGNSGSLKFAFQYARDNLSENDGIYFVEDDFLHLEQSELYLREGLTIGDYVSLYDHLDKYMIPSQNPYVKDGGEDTKVLLTRFGHWKYTNSTVQTFYTKVKTLIEDWNELHLFNFKSNIPDSFNTFIELGKKDRKIVTPIPGRATACDNFPSPLINWGEVAKKYMEK